MTHNSFISSNKFNKTKRGCNPYSKTFPFLNSKLADNFGFITNTQHYPKYEANNSDCSFVIRDNAVVRS